MQGMHKAIYSIGVIVNTDETRAIGFGEDEFKISFVRQGYCPDGLQAGSMVSVLDMAELNLCPSSGLWSEVMESAWNVAAAAYEIRLSDVQILVPMSVDSVVRSFSGWMIDIGNAYKSDESYSVWSIDRENLYIVRDTKARDAEYVVGAPEILALKSRSMIDYNKWAIVKLAMLDRVFLEGSLKESVTP